MDNMSLQQWFMYCGDNAEKVKEYEDLAIKYYDRVYAKDAHKEDLTYSTLSKPLLKQFYNNDTARKNRHMIFTSIKCSIVMAILGLILFLIFPILQGFKYNSTKQKLMNDTYLNTVIQYDNTKFMDNFSEGFTDWFKNTDKTYQVNALFEYNEDNPIPEDKTIEDIFNSISIKSDMPVGWALFIILICIVLGIGMGMMIDQIYFESITNKLKKKENILIPIISKIPVKFRSFEYMDTLQRIYYKDQSITFTQASDVAIEFMRHNKSRSITSILFDVPYTPVIDEQPTYVEQNIQSNIDSAENDTKQERPVALPADIDIKTFAGSDDAERDLNKMIGLASVKEQLIKLKNRIEFYGSSDVGSGGNHMVFLGSAGTGKTSVARIVTKIMYDLGYIKENKCVEVSGDYLKSPYTGQTGDRTNAIVEWAMGGVLFIDEAYLLYDNSSASQEATGVLLKAMEDRRKDFIIILAGYEEQMTKLLASNEGFNSRIKYKIYFPDYTVDEMYQIFTHFVNNYNGNHVYLVEDLAKDLLCHVFELEKQSRSFGNARTVRNAVDAIMDNFADRCIKTGDKSNIITYDDVEKYAILRQNELQHEIRNTSAVNQVDESIIRLSELKNKVKEGSIDPDKDLNEMVGLASLQEEVKLLQSQKEFYGDNIAKQNILLIGPNGCGKSSVAKILTGYLYKYGYIADNRYLEISAEFLKGSYVGHTAKRAESIISYANGGVLFIKNIHLLLDTTDNFAQEAMSAIINALSSSNIPIIISDADGQALLNIQNLFSLIYVFPEYTNEDLLQIFNSYSKKDGFTIDQAALTKLNQYITSKQFNIRDIAQLYDKTKKKHITNFTNGQSPDKYTLTANDIDTIVPVIKLNINIKK